MVPAWAELVGLRQLRGPLALVVLGNNITLMVITTIGVAAALVLHMAIMRVTVVLVAAVVVELRQAAQLELEAGVQ